MLQLKLVHLPFFSFELLGQLGLQMHNTSLELLQFESILACHLCFGYFEYLDEVRLHLRHLVPLFLKRLLLVVLGHPHALAELVHAVLDEVPLLRDHLQLLLHVLVGPHQTACDLVGHRLLSQVAVRHFGLDLNQRLLQRVSYFIASGLHFGHGFSMLMVQQGHLPTVLLLGLLEGQFLPVDLSVQLVVLLFKRLHLGLLVALFFDHLLMEISVLTKHAFIITGRFLQLCLKSL